VERAAELYTGGMSLSEVATHFGVAPDTVRRHLRQAGVTMRPVGRPRPASARVRSRPRQWRDILTAALAQQEAISVRGTVISYLRRTPTRSEITAARRAAHRLAASGEATILRVRPPRLGRGGGSAHLVLARLGTGTPSGLLDRLTDANVSTMDPCC
jgi:transposase-like protein